MLIYYLLLLISETTKSKDCRKLHRDVQSKCGSVTFLVTLPDTMTTWVLQAIGVSSTAGFGIAKPLHITTFQPFFIHLSMPYSVQRGEEISILATIFNFKNHDELVKYQKKVVQINYFMLIKCILPLQALA